VTIGAAAAPVAAGGAHDVFPGPVVRVAVHAGGFEVVQANREAAALLATTVDGLLGDRMVHGFFEDDALLLIDALADPDRERPPLGLRWGHSPPVTVLGVDLRRDTDGTVLVAIHDRTDQHMLDAILCGQSTLAQTFDVDGFATWISPQSAATIGMAAASYVGKHTVDLVLADDLPIVLRATQEMAVDPEGTAIAWYRVGHPEIPGVFWAFRNTLIFRPEDPAIGGAISVSRMVVSRAGQGVEAEGHPDGATAEMMPAGLLVSGSDRLQFRNQLARRLLGPSVDTDDPKRWLEELRPEHRGAVDAALVAAADLGHRSNVTAMIDTAESVWIRIEVMPSFDARGTHVGYAATLLDITAEHLAREAMQGTQELLWRMANHDSLTGLPNRMRFHDRLGLALGRTRREGRTTALLFCDLDHFKQVNDNFGHAGGDILLVEIARRLSDCLRETDTVSRLGGDEFVIICEAFDDITDVEALAERLIAVINRPVPIGIAGASVGVCIGIAQADGSSTADDLLARADAGVYEAKQNGRNRSVTIAV
jgi:diguanylate cyclase (GGDEF)-like protein